MNPDLVRKIADDEQSRRGWKLTVNGTELPDVQEAVLYNEKMDVEVRYGMRAEGYDGVAIHEPGGGGSVLVPFVLWHGDLYNLYIGMLEQERKTQGGVVLNLPRGFLDPGQSHFQTAVREMQEETGVSVEENRVVDLGEFALPANPNSAYFDTSGPNEGAHFYGVEFASDEVERIAVTTFVFKKEIISPIDGDRVAERILSCKFYRWNKAAKVSDMFTNAGVIRLLAYLHGIGNSNFS